MSKTRGKNFAVALLTGGGDPHYAYGLTDALVAQGLDVEVIGSDDFETPEFQNKPGITLFNLRGNMDTRASFKSKLTRVLTYYARLIGYAATAQPRVFHILWNNKFETFDRTLLMVFYRILGKKVALTAHNVNTARRDGCDSFLNRATLKIQYRLCRQIFAHTEKIKSELIEEFGVREDRVTIIPFGINNAVAVTPMTPESAKQRLNISTDAKTILFFGRIAPAKGLDILISAIEQLQAGGKRYRLVVAGRPDRCKEYWQRLQQRMAVLEFKEDVLLRSEFIPDQDIEIYFKAADVLVLPYRHIYQSGVLFLGQSFGIPVLASDVGSLREDVIEGETGLIFRPEDATALMQCIEKYFSGDLYKNLPRHREIIRELALARHSWNTVGAITTDAYSRMINGFPDTPVAVGDAHTSPRSRDLSV